MLNVSYFEVAFMNNYIHLMWIFYFLKFCN